MAQGVKDQDTAKVASRRESEKGASYIRAQEARVNEWQIPSGQQRWLTI